MTDGAAAFLAVGGGPEVLCQDGLPKGFGEVVVAGRPAMAVGSDQKRYSAVITNARPRGSATRGSQLLPLPKLLS